MPNGIDNYIAEQPEPVRTTLTKLCAMIRKAVPKGTTEGISYKMPVFKSEGPLIGFAAFDKHWGLYPMSGTVVGTLAADLKGRATSKGSIRFGLEELPSAALLKKILRTRLDEIESAR